MTAQPYTDENVLVPADPRRGDVDPSAVADAAAVDGDNALRGWVAAARSGGLPTPTRERWQVLRGGVVNLWEFEVAEYWLADGRAQLVGENQSGKSTLMALTTLTRLAGDLDRQYIDTFGQQSKSFRYYVEATDDPADRRETDKSTSRGWAWVEYGRLTDDGPQYFTTLLFAKARRGKNDYGRTWATCHGHARVGDGLTLYEGAQVLDPASLSSVAGFDTAASGSEYRQRVTKTVFGFVSTDRLDAVIRMLKVLRTPHLGQKLDPAFFTEQMREALPAVARSEIDALADGWDELDRLAAERDSARSALDAVREFIRRSWNPWADTVLRLAADNLAAAITRYDDVTRTARAARIAAEQARVALEDAGEKLDSASKRRRTTDVALRNHLLSDAYRNASNATSELQRLNDTAKSAEAAATDAESERDRAATLVGRHDKSVTAAREESARLQDDVDAHRGRTRDAGGEAGLAGDLAEWVATGDHARLARSVSDRKQHVRRARQLLGAYETQRGKAEAAETARAAAEAAHSTRERAAAEAAEHTTAELQSLSDALEGWAAGFSEQHDTAPAPALREQWLSAVRATADSSKPRPVLREQIHSTWLGPTTAPLREQAGAAEASADAHRKQAKVLLDHAEQVRTQTDPEPPAPYGWTRRVRPTGTELGAPLWRLLDPRDDLEAAQLDQLEAALAAAGLLDAWVTPNGIWSADRDGSDVVLRTGDRAGDGAHSDTGIQVPQDRLSRLLQPAADCGSCHDSVLALLDAVHLQPGAPLFVTVDGRWGTATAAGHALAATNGAELIGTAARQSARERRVAELTQQAQDETEAAGEAARDARELRRRAQRLEELAAAAPRDDEFAAAVRDQRTAELEEQRAASELDRRTRAAQAANREADDANSELLRFAGEHTLPATSAGLEDLTRLLDHVATRVSDLRRVLEQAHAAQKALQAAEIALSSAQEQLDDWRARATTRRRAAEETRGLADAAKAAVGRDDQQALARAQELQVELDGLEAEIQSLSKTQLDQKEAAARAETPLTQHTEARADAETARDAALAAFWVPVNAGLARARALPEPAGDLVTHGRDLARAVRSAITPAGWPDGEDVQAKTTRVHNTELAMTGRGVTNLRVVLEGSGGRSVTVASDERTAMPVLAVRVDTLGDAVGPHEAVTRLQEQVERLASAHDEKMNQVLVTLLASTFVEHLRDRLLTVLRLVDSVNSVLLAHPTGANRAVMRLDRVPNAQHPTAFSVIEALVGPNVDDEGVQGQIRDFLEAQIREAQERGRAGAGEWKDHLAELLDYRRWFDVRTETRVETRTGDSRWIPLTKEKHAQDSGGGKVVTLLQPLVSTLVALYGESAIAPRPLWLDEAFTGVDAANRATMLDMLVEFDMDFLLAGPAALVSTAQVPSAAIWHVTRAPAPMPGVDLSLSLWAGRVQRTVRTPDVGFGGAAQATIAGKANAGTQPAHDEPSLFSEDLWPVTGSAAGSATGSTTDSTSS
ncbi:MAG: SbcC/MukB-like Walker B domain-containing protein [Angustibacter sp.]